MNGQIKKTLAILLMVCFLLSVTAAGVNAAPPVDKVTGKSERLKSEDVANEFAKKIKADKQTKAADAALQAKGYKVKTGVNATMGMKDTFKGKDETGKEVEITQTMKVIDYEKKNSKDAAAIAEIEVSAQGETRKYVAILEAPNGEIEDATEQFVTEDGKVEKANSWWSCTYNQIRSRCGDSKCINSLYTCWNGSWAYYLGCVAYNCWCYAKASLCCSCDCSWWCKWAVGCCDS